MMSAHAVMFGNPETGRPIPAEQINAVTCKTSDDPCHKIAATHHDEEPGMGLVEGFTDPLGDRYEKYRSDGMRNAGTSSAP